MLLNCVHQLCAGAASRVWARWADKSRNRLITNGFIGVRGLCSIYEPVSLLRPL